ncbi:MAG: GNAT family N-acetyltransferase [Bacillota bacterium]
MKSVWQGERIRLRPMVPSDWESCFRWDQDSDIQRRCDSVHFPRSPEGVELWAQEESARTPINDQFRWMIETLEGETIGTINTFGCSRRNGTFRYGLAIAREHQRRGYGSEAIMLVMRYYFQELRYQKATVSVYDFNHPSIGLHEHLGFQLEGHLRRMVYTKGEYFDELVYGMTSEEFTTRYADFLSQE